MTFWVVVGFCALLMADSIFRRDWHVELLSIAPVLLAVWLVGMLTYWPSIRIEDEALTVVNPGWRMRVPWPRIVEVRQRLQIILELDDGREVSCWGSPFPTKPGARRGIRSSSLIAVHDDAASRALDAIRGRVDEARGVGPASAGAAVRTVDWALLAIGAILVAAVILEAALSR